MFFQEFDKLEIVIFSGENVDYRFYIASFWFFLSPPDVYEGDGDHGDDEVEDGGGQHEVHAAYALLGEGNATPCRLSQILALVHQKVHLDENNSRSQWCF